ncbi:MAG: type II secretion system protein [Planctomycetales bacterium]|nr:type II secretion system protein [Planctomycetales bacterium]
MSSCSHSSSQRAARRGFTLVELLVVIAIIVLLVALLVPAISVARYRMWAATVMNEISQMDRAVKAFEERWGSIPPDFSDIKAGVPWDQSVAYRFLRKTWPKMTANERGIVQYLASNAVNNNRYLDNDTAIWFWLSGMSESATNPFTGPGGPLSANSLNNDAFKFKEGRLVDARPTIPAGTIPGLGIAVTMRHYLPEKVDKPFLYFDSRTYGMAMFDATLLGTGGLDQVTPYVLQGGQYDWANPAPSGCQIIATGRDEMYSTGAGVDPTGYMVPACYPKAGWHTNLAAPPNFFENHLDNFTNFSSRRLQDFERN